MKQALRKALGIGFVLAAPIVNAQPENAAGMSDNPLFTESTLPLRYPRFDLLRDEHFAPAFDRGLAEHLEEVNAIATNPEPPTFENTIVALERSGRLAQRAFTTFFNLVSADTNDARRALQVEYAPKLAAHGDEILLNRALFERIETLYENRASLGLDAEAVRLIERIYSG